MKRGILLEDEVRLVVEKELGAKIKKIGLLLNAECPIFGASPDGRCGDRLIEIKCPYSRKVTDAIPPEYLPQIHLQMACCDLTKSVFSNNDIKEFESEVCWSLQGELVV